MKSLSSLRDLRLVTIRMQRFHDLLPTQSLCCWSSLKSCSGEWFHMCCIATTHHHIQQLFPCAHSFSCRAEKWFFSHAHGSVSSDSAVWRNQWNYLTLTLYRGASFNNSLSGTSEPTTPRRIPWDRFKTKENPFSEAKPGEFSTWKHIIVLLVVPHPPSLGLCESGYSKTINILQKLPRAYSSVYAIFTTVIQK